jgi:hypothetical protein
MDLCRRCIGDSEGRLQSVIAEKPLSQGHEAVAERVQEVQQMSVQGREWSVSLVNCED